MGDLRLVHALGLSIPSSRLLEKYGDRLRSAPVVGIHRQPPAVMVNPDRDDRDGIGGIPAASEADEQNPLGNGAAGDGDGTANVKDGTGQKWASRRGSAEGSGCAQTWDANSFPVVLSKL